MIGKPVADGTAEDEIYIPRRLYTHTHIYIYM